MATTRTVDGHRIRLTSLDRILYPETGTTKRDVIDYYAAIAPVLVPHARQRAATRKRWMEGTGTVDVPGESFYHRQLDEDAPSWMRHYAIRHRERTVHYPLLNDEATLLWFAQRAALEFHVPQWRFGTRGRQQPPDRMVFDLDPGGAVGLHECAQVAQALRTRLDEAGLPCVPVTSGSKGIHLYAALDGTRDSDEVTQLARDLAESVQAEAPGTVVTTMDKSERRGRVFIDWSQNRATKSTVTPYSLRGRSRPWVAAPRTWDELASADLSQMECSDVLERAQDGTDLLAPLLGARSAPRM